MWKEGILPDLNAKGVQLDALKRLAAKKFEEDYTVKVVDRLNQVFFFLFENLRILAFVWFFYFFIVKIN
jgi:hypothetical protein